MSLDGKKLVAFEAYKQHIARIMIDGGEGKRVRQILERLRFDDFEAGWDAALDSIEIELPSCFEVYGEYSAETARMATDCCAEAIEAAGLKVKP